MAAAGTLLMAGCSWSDESPRTEDPSSTDLSPSESPSESPDQSPSESPDSVTDSDGPSGGGATLDPGDVPKDVAEQTDQATEEFLDRVGEELEEPDAKQDLKTLPGVTGAALEELRNRITEYDASGWQVLGEPVIVRQRVVRLLQDPERAIVHACIDNSAVRVVDADGKRVPNSRPAEPRTRNIITLVKKKDAWIVTDQRPATKPDC
ncbi:hypothetical protein [Nocardioides gilvus]|uniref:hypothetical protein n=1 Tax=Nocardioides gilvus TaxID=1735589 RepID=UPI000D7434D0|nr:hypothetical protein [Nocardioides gilvus]